MKRIFAIVLACGLAPAAFAETAAPTTGSEAGLAAVAELGRINGTALACQQPAIVSRSRNAVLTGVPKTRAYGEAFENATQAAYLEQGKEAACPDGTALSNRLQAAEKSLQAAFPAGQ